MKEVQKYINKYNNITKKNAQQAVNDFLTNYSNWKNVVGYITNEKDGGEEYGNALVIFSNAIFEMNPTQVNHIETLKDEIQEYEDNVKIMFHIKYNLYGNLGLCWHKLGSLYDNKAIEAFKKYIYYQLTLSNNTSYGSLNCYSFRNCSKYLLQSLISETLNLSSPSTFNDIFDCPIIELMNNDDEVSKLIRKAYLNSIKVACFVKNEKLPYTDKNGKDIRNEKKNKNDNEEYLNELMWAHYADSHKGICIKYKFPSNLTVSAIDKKDYVTYFKDVEYISNLEKYSNQNSINMNDAFFAKGKSWEYENELRFLYCKPTSNENLNHISLPIPNCIEAVYFGVKCSDEDKQTIKNILKGRKCISYKYQIGNTKKIKEEKDIEFYQMKIDDKKFGVIKAIKVV